MRELIDKPWSHCPRCSSNRVQRMATWPLYMFAFLLFFPGSLLYVAIWPPLQILGLILPATMVLFIVLNPIWECQDCKLTWPAREFKNQK